MKLSEKQIETISKIAAQAVLEHLEKERQKQEKEKRDRRLRNTKLLLRNYRNFKRHCESIPQELKNLDEHLQLDEWGKEELAIESIKRSKERTMAMVKFIDKMLAVYKVMCDLSEKEEDKRSYQTIYLLYISDKKFTAAEIATCHKTDIRTVYRDVERACKALSTLIFGVDSIRFYE
ncbi:hypothetical protein B0I26_10378 [Anoxybacillus vitaminiphilus]|uniref:Uncharacterized protein n=1 Tax=Paranoxybacillus vitaminiphilus TaxID=581036 RepID=A0A327YLQ7_9BACL|nr:hypothetical protein [Anoxybacillus vitaminiphilus]RAK21126.1 hypothetical protein B0I26_10378 [Anoxybacillus vitaminiphilus]